MKLENELQILICRSMLEKGKNIHYIGQVGVAILFSEAEAESVGGLSDATPPTILIEV